jgi:CRISPR-associated protein Csb1
MFKDIPETAPRLLIEVPLKPVQGDRFQPTGFADLGAASYRLPDGTPMLLVESTQSIANRLESTIIDPDQELVEEVKGLSYISVQLEGASGAKTNSLVEAHRINSPFIISNREFHNTFQTEADYAKGKPLNWQKIAQALYKYDVNSLLHGAFLANLEDGRVKVARVVSGFIEATDVREVVSGGVKNNALDPSGKIRATEYDKDVYGNVPYQRVEYTASNITGYFNIDLGLLRSYNLGNEAFEMLVSLALYKIGCFLDRGLRLRTACDFKVAGPIEVTEPTGFSFPNTKAALEVLTQKIEATKAMFADPPVTKLSSKVSEKKSDDKNEG